MPYVKQALPTEVGGEPAPAATSEDGQIALWHRAADAGPRDARLVVPEMIAQESGDIESGSAMVRDVMTEVARLPRAEASQTPCRFGDREKGATA